MPSNDTLLIISVSLNVMTLAWLVALQFARTAGEDTLPAFPDLTRERKLFEAEKMYVDLVDSIEGPHDVTSRDVVSSLYGLNITARLRMKEKAEEQRKKMDTEDGVM